jgi:hypothetical protein
MIIQAIEVTQEILVSFTPIIWGRVPKKYACHHKGNIGVGFTLSEAITNCLNALKK